VTRREWDTTNGTRRGAYLKVRLKESGATLLREDGRLEWQCAHGVGHPVGHLFPEEWAQWMHTHGCDGCCTKLAVSSISEVTARDVASGEGVLSDKGK
jgi:aminoglycoside phosphotransferase